ncbi:hypothetical protein [Thiolapillus sp.]
MADPVIKPLLPVWPIAPTLPAGKESRREKPVQERPASSSKKKKDGRKHIDLYA